jgi:mRNA-degrading endonuclease RelE of RelBE toxin-antitoxin system
VEKQAAKYLDRLNEPMKGRILDALEKLAAVWKTASRSSNEEGDIRKLRGQETAYRLRIGDYRVLFKQKPTCLAVYKIASRGQSYKGKK